MKVIRNIFSFFFGFRGRIGRLHYFIFLILYMPISLIFIGLPNPISNIPLSLILLSLLLLLLITRYSHTIRRVHDYNKNAFDSGLFMATFFSDFIALYNTIMKGGELGYLITLILLAISVISMIILIFIKGDQEENKFGPKPVSFWKKIITAIKKYN